MILHKNDEMSMFFEEIESTNTFAIDLLSKTNPQHGLCIYTDYQTAGKGQIGRSWHSEAGKNMLASWILHHESLDIADVFYLNMAVSLAINDALNACSIKSCVKWPNDIYVGDKKIAGILIQNVLRNNSVKSSVVGIGLNINQMDFPSQISNPTSMAVISNQNWDRLSVRNLCAKYILSRHQQLLARDFELLKTDYLQNLYLYRNMHRFRKLDGESLDGLITDVLQDGRLVITDEKSISHRFDIKEIAF